MKKVLNKSILTYLLMFLSLFILSAFMYIFAKSLIDLNSYGFGNLRYSLLWLGFSLSWILIFLSVLPLLNLKHRLIYYYILNVLWIIVFIVQICYVGQLGKFMIFSDLFVAGEGLQYVKSVLIHLNPGMVIMVIFSVACMVGVYFLNKGLIEKENRKKKVIFAVLLFLGIVVRLVSYFSLGSVATPNTWQENYNAKSIYSNFTNPNTSMYITGLYEYSIRSVYKHFYNLITLDKTALKKEIDHYDSIYGINYSTNDYTGIFKGKNVIYIMMESIDSWIIDDDTMPTLKHLKETGMNFTNRYSPFFNGGQTINSEFALNTGLYAISSRDTIYDVDDIDYNYSLANILKKNGYSANSFHANTGTFYNRSNFHKRLGYMHHYAALDMQKAGMLDENKNYYADTELFGDDDIYKLMTSDEPFLAFFTTYSAHLEYTSSNKVYKTIKHPYDINKYNEEELIYRTLAYDTDAAIKSLIDKLEEHDILDDTILVLVSDHYVYGYSDGDYVALKKNVLNDQKELQNTPFIIWAKDMEHQDIDKILDTADILPTVLNMLGIQYNPNKYMGVDVFSDNADDFVWFSDGSFIKSKNCTLSDEAILTKSNYNIKKNKDILLTNYYGS